MAVDKEQLSRHIRHLASLGPRIDGAAADLAAVEYIGEELRAAGATVETFAAAVPVIENLTSSFALLGEDGREIECLANLRPGLTDEEGVTAELVFAGKGFDADFAAADCAGRIAVCYADEPFEGEGGVPRYAHDRTVAAEKAGCAGLILSHRREDNLICSWGLDRELDLLPSANIGFQDFLALRDRLAEGALRANLRICGDVRSGAAEMVSGRVAAAEETSSTIVIVGSHHETVPGSPGANDNGSGIAALIELARDFSADPLKNSNLLLLATGGEESGHWGNADWVEANAGWMKRDVRGVFVALCFGVGNLAIQAKKWNGMAGDERLAAVAKEAAAELGQDLGSLEPVPFLSEATEFLDQGIPAMLLMPDVREMPYYHTSGDTFDRVDIDRVASVTELLALSARRLDEKAP